MLSDHYKNNSKIRKKPSHCVKAFEIIIKIKTLQMQENYKDIMHRHMHIMKSYIF